MSVGEGGGTWSGGEVGARERAWAKKRFRERDRRQGWEWDGWRSAERGLGTVGREGDGASSVSVPASVSEATSSEPPPAGTSPIPG